LNLSAISQCMRIFVLSCGLLLCGCSALISPAMVGLTDNLSHAILNNNDLATVEAGAPAYLLMIDSLLRQDPDNEALLRSAASLYAAYTDVFVKDKIRSQKLTDKSLGYALKAMCVRKGAACSLRETGFDEFKAIIETMNAKDIPSLYTLGASWAGWIQAHRQDWNAVAEISRVDAIMQQVVALDESFEDGGAHLYLGALATLLPPALGGKPDVGRRHFERAIVLSEGKNLMVKVLYARQYARLLFDRELHDRLLNEVLEADPGAPGYVLSNTLAQQQAKALLESAEDYF